MTSLHATKAELRWQVYTSLAIGSKGVLYFCYWTPPGGDFERGQAIMVPTPGKHPPDTAVQVPGSKYPMVQRINSKLKVYGAFLLHAVSTAVVQATGTAETTAVFGGGGGGGGAAPVASINGTQTGPTWQFMLGYFDDHKTMLLVNQDSNHPALASLTFNPAVAGCVDTGARDGGGGGAARVLMEVDPSHGTISPALDDSPFHPGFQVQLIAGDARLFTWR